MNIFTVTTAYLAVENGKQVTRSKEREFRFPQNADEITMRQWTDFQLRKADAPEWFRKFERMSVEERETDMKAWDEDRWGEFFYTLADLLSCVVDANASEILRSLPPISDGKTALLTLYLTLDAVINGYQPKERSTFEWKGVQYVWPQKVVDNMGRQWWGQNLTTAEAIEALQIEHVYNAKDEKGVYILADRKYHVDIALLAVLSKKVKQDGTVENVPLEYNARHAHIEKRIATFADAPMSVALDMAFFLTSSKTRLAVTHISRMHSTLTQTTSRRPRP